MTEVEKINNSKLGKVVGKMLEYIGEPTYLKNSVWLIQYVRMSASMILAFHWEYPNKEILLDREELLQILKIPNTPESYRQMMEEVDEEEVIQEFENGLQTLKDYMKKYPNADEEIWLFNGEIMQDTILTVTAAPRDEISRELAGMNELDAEM